jgi:hypothetical protein
MGDSHITQGFGSAPFGEAEIARVVDDPTGIRVLIIHAQTVAVPAIRGHDRGITGHSWPPVRPLAWPPVGVPGRMAPWKRGGMGRLDDMEQAQ